MLTRLGSSQMFISVPITIWLLTVHCGCVCGGGGSGGGKMQLNRRGREGVGSVCEQGGLSVLRHSEFSSKTAALASLCPSPSHINHSITPHHHRITCVLPNRPMPASRSLISRHDSLPRVLLSSAAFLYGGGVWTRGGREGEGRGEGRRKVVGQVFHDTQRYQLDKCQDEAAKHTRCCLLVAKRQFPWATHASSTAHSTLCALLYVHTLN